MERDSNEPLPACPLCGSVGVLVGSALCGVGPAYEVWRCYAHRPEHLYLGRPLPSTTSSTEGPAETRTEEAIASTEAPARMLSEAVADLARLARRAARDGSVSGSVRVLDAAAVDVLPQALDSCTTEPEQGPPRPLGEAIGEARSATTEALGGWVAVDLGPGSPAGSGGPAGSVEGQAAGRSLRRRAASGGAPAQPPHGQHTKNPPPRSEAGSAQHHTKSAHQTEGSTGWVACRAVVHKLWWNARSGSCPTGEWDRLLNLLDACEQEASAAEAELASIRRGRARVHRRFAAIDAGEGCRCPYCTKDGEALAELAADYELSWFGAQQRLAEAARENERLRDALRVARRRFETSAGIYRECRIRPEDVRRYQAEIDEALDGRRRD